MFITTALFASDAFTLQAIASRRTPACDSITARAISQDLPGVDAAGHETDAVIAGLGTLYTLNMLSPRFGVTVKLDRTGRTILRANYGRFNQGVLTGELDPISPGIATTTTMAYDAATGGYDRPVSVVDPKSQIALDPRTRSPHTDEWSLALERGSRRELSVSGAYIRKRGADFIGWTDTGGDYRSDTRTVAGGMMLPVLILTNRPSDRRFLLTNPRELFLDTTASSLAVEKRLVAALAGVRFLHTVPRVRSSGHEQRGGGRSAIQHHRASGLPDVRSGSQRPHECRPAGCRTIGRTSCAARASCICRGGAPVRGQHSALQRQAVGRDRAGTAGTGSGQPARCCSNPRGSRRLSSQSLLDLRISKGVRVPKAGRVDLIMDVLNLLNDRAEEALASDTLGAEPRLAGATQFMDPRRACFGCVA